MSEMTTDVATLTSQAHRFEHIADELKESIRRVELTASGLLLAWRGQASLAAQAAIVLFRQAASHQVKQLNEISTKISTAAMHYQQTDSDQTSLLSAQMDF
ncbi:Secreted antigenic protein MTSA-10 [Mycobacterium basiliense]|uniref:Secreted antigenic protein MTSA-10 n=1 Tax=Mycobacterium basiliense TaxID=2094119 RepID=A0A3S4FMM0_9MYCO|nr:WXG100 family type VII secretion target [Mycobacterium basiliense]VDM86611.1 Secreted antigenic protein MTSA-10 [Mycobacterium basiliense]